MGRIRVFQGSEIPALYLTVDSKELAKVNKSKENEITEGRAVYQEADGSISYDGEIRSFKGRGNSTFGYSKKPYQLKLEKKANLSGMGKARTWLLIANWQDLSLLRNQMMMNLAKQIGVTFALDCIPVDLYLNGEYNGLYLMTEKVQIGKHRVNITNLEDAVAAVNQDTPVEEAEPFRETSDTGVQTLRGYEIANDPEEITGGYILEIEKPARFRDYIQNGFITADGLSVTIKEPTYASRAQVTYAAELVSDFHAAALAEDGISPETGKYYAEYINMDSFARKYWVEEVSKNYDAFASSQFMVKDSDSVDGLLYAGPCWDYDLSLGNIFLAGRQNAANPEGEYQSRYGKKNHLYWALYRHDDFQEAINKVYREEVSRALRIFLGDEAPGEGDVICSISEYAARIEKSAEMNFARWPESNVHGYYTESGKTHEKSVQYLEKFLRKRYEYLQETQIEGGEKK